MEKNRSKKAKGEKDWAYTSKKNKSKGESDGT